MTGKDVIAASLGLIFLGTAALRPPAAPARGAALEGLTVPARETRLLQPAPPPDLRSLLAAAAAYCDRLSRSVLDFVCRERVEEWFYPEVAPAKAWDRKARRSVVVGRRVTHDYLYDYQLVRDRKGSVRESRTLLEEDGKEVRVPDALLKTRLFWHARVVMGPLGLLSRERQAEHDFRIVRETKEDGERVVVIEAVPKPGVAADHLVGTVWLRSGDAAILRIEWDPSSIDDYAGVEAAAERFQMTPRVVLTSEYALEKNGIRFPRRYTVKETYVRGGRRFQRSQIDVRYDRYKFFTVETLVIF